MFYMDRCLFDSDFLYNYIFIVLYKVLLFTLHNFLNIYYLINYYIYINIFLLKYIIFSSPPRLYSC